MAGLPYDVPDVEARWRTRWDAEGVSRVDLDAPGLTRADVFYNLVEFPYPSAEGLHVGHVFKYAGADVFGRYHRMRGKQVFQPIGFDAFGIHTENFALKRDRHPADLTGRTTENFRAQLSRIGCAWDWSRAVDTSRPDYYRWTQWLLVQLFRAGLMYLAEAPVTWCPSCLTVLAREQTEGDRCERCDTPVTERVMRQWFLRITQYADRLLDGLDSLDWPERAKRLQRAWIGRSEGREIGFGDLTVFTTRPDTIDGVTFLAVPPAHDAAGSTRPHPRTGDPVPVVAADYVVADYGTGSVMGVPAHDERDRTFALANGLPIVDAPLLTDADVARVGRPAVRYRLRDWLISRQRYWGPPIPIVHCDACGPVAVPEDRLPVELPYVDDFRPSGSGTSPLASVGEWVRTPCPSCGAPARRETDVSDTFVDSSWYFLRYPSTDVVDAPWDDGRTALTLPVDHYAGGPEHVQRHHLYARFVTMALHDLGLVPFDEPFPRVRLGGFIVHGGARMSKSRGNVIGPDEFVDRHGSDVTRCALLFSAPWDQGGDFQLDAVAGVERFFARAWRAVERAVEAGEGDDLPARFVVDVAGAIEAMHHNVAIARLMEAVPAVTSATAASTFVRLLAPLAPHLAEELWSRLGGSFSVHVAPWPEVDASALLVDEVDVVVQVDGRVRDVLRVAPGTADDVVREMAVASDKVRAAVDGREVMRVVVVPDRVVNLVTG
ncbi:MAG TPA: class I tRNA ligase family protein [Acidimicrobiales bacterium]